MGNGKLNVVEQLEVFELLRSQGWVDAAGAFASGSGLLHASPAERSQAERVSSNLEWLAQAGAHEREHGRYSLLRRDLRAVRVEIRRLNRFFRANGEVDRIIYRENPVLSLLRGWAALGSVRRPSTTRVSA